jgi:hypothetical protein
MSEEDCLIHWSKEPLREIHSVNQPMTHRKPYGLWFSVGDGPDGWRAWCDGPDVAAQMAEAFVAAVAGHRREIEANGGTSRVVN